MRAVDPSQNYPELLVFELEAVSVGRDWQLKVPISTSLKSFTFARSALSGTVPPGFFERLGKVKLLAINHNGLVGSLMRGKIEFGVKYRSK